MRHFYKPRHAADYNARAARAATELADVYQPRHAAPEQPEYQPRRLVHNHGIDPFCAERTVNGSLRGACLTDAGQPVAVVYTGHGLSHGTYRPDVAL